MTNYHLGLPAWAFPGWSGEYFPATGSVLSHYARVFNTVEGNTTFYRVPDADSVARWLDAVAATDFRFSLKQCPATLGPDSLEELQALFNRLPGTYQYALEVRHADFFSRPALLEPLLERSGAGRVMFDSRPIHREDTRHPEVLAARHKKPDVPLLDTVYNGLAYARVVLHPEPSHNGPYVEEWLRRCATYLASGHTVYFMMHCPNNQHCPEFAVAFHQRLRETVPTLAPLPPWPVPRQAGLF